MKATAGSPFDWRLFLFCLFITAALMLILNSCKKEVQNVPMGIEGDYSGFYTIEWIDSTGFHSNTYNEGGYVTQISDKQIYLEPFKNAGGNGAGLVVYCSGSNLNVLNQRYNGGYAEGSGKYNGGITLELDFTKNGQYFKIYKTLTR
jgi:hypothetical protein